LFGEDPKDGGDMAAYPWIVLTSARVRNSMIFPDLKRWFETIRERTGC
jgi:hypothetical protein